MRIIKGCPRDEWEEVQAVQHEPFIYIHHNGSKWAGEEPDDIAHLLGVLAEHRLDVESYGHDPADFATLNPCAGVDNPNWTLGSSEPRWINGPRLYECNGVVRFFGNFSEYSHGFCIDTNDLETIDALSDAIAVNFTRFGGAE